MWFICDRLGKHCAFLMMTQFTLHRFDYSCYDIRLATSWPCDMAWKLSFGMISDGNTWPLFSTYSLNDMKRLSSLHSYINHHVIRIIFRLIFKQLIWCIISNPLTIKNTFFDFSPFHYYSLMVTVANVFYCI